MQRVWSSSSGVPLCLYERCSGAFVSVSACMCHVCVREGEEKGMFMFVWISGLNQIQRDQQRLVYMADYESCRAWLNKCDDVRIARHVTFPVQWGCKPLGR